MFNYEDTLGYYVNRVVIRYKKELIARFKDYDITTEQWGILTRMKYSDGISQTQITAKTLKDLPTVTRILDKLQKKGLIIKEQDPKDSRATLIFLTDEAKELVIRLDKVAKEVENKATQSLETQDIEKIKTLLSIMVSNLE